ncbi:hypothetical protein CPHO_03890 [Corynebacterium phocae]|uniref:IrrE N-terminal-like domain-containing protein n=1 Tax=Corynebacterium phocae TaxID=161895 RepID=A0A1L7D237_9CORY|nr:ImmA/IrrE family metallo-endopeptidase [Corynebacterium phocae]APT92168.1 hypothetical protein CPHO_03890 [Corynebacterium phocae]KAA8725955.1 ImmA/IrrE family metallo-endopeptidase [Corynebacterium phocae]
MSNEAEGRALAAKFRKEHGLGSRPIGDLVAVVEQATGAMVDIFDAPRDEHGLSILDPKTGKVFIAVARTPHPMRQRSSLAHELGHVLSHDFADEIACGRNAAEIRADAFARHLLIPQEGLKEMAPPPGTDITATLSKIVQRFLVSPKIALIAMRDFGIVDASQCQALGDLVTTPSLALRYGWDAEYRALANESNSRRAPQQLLSRAVAGYQCGVVSPVTIGALRGVSPQRAEQDLREAGVVPHEETPPPLNWEDMSSGSPWANDVRAGAAGHA